METSISTVSFQLLFLKTMTRRAMMTRVQEKVSVTVYITLSQKMLSDPLSAKVSLWSSAMMSMVYRAVGYCFMTVGICY